MTQALGNLKAARISELHHFIQIDQADLAGLIRPAGYFNQKARYLKALSLFLRKQDFLLYCLNRPSFVIDAYTRRIAKAFGLARGDEKYSELQALFVNNLPKDIQIYQEYHALLVEHGKTHYSKQPHGINDPLKPLA